jgi:hypothetical protein
MRSCIAISVIFLLSLTFAVIASARDEEYNAKQVNLKIDGNLGEWSSSDIIIFDQLKDAGTQVPKETDFSGTGMIGWNSKDPNRVYFAAIIVDDKNQDIHPHNDKWWEDDSLEVMFDFTNDGSLVQWTIDANGEEISSAAVEENLEWIVVNDGNQYVFEGAIDPTKDNPAKPGFGKNFKADVGLVIGLSFHYNDCENGTREHQIGWIAGSAWGAENFGDLVFSQDQAALEPLDKLTTKWGRLRSF